MIKITGNSGVYGRNMAKRYGIVNSGVAVSDNASTTIAEMGQLVIDLTTGQVNYVDSSTKTQVLS